LLAPLSRRGSRARRHPLPAAPVAGADAGSGGEKQTKEEKDKKKEEEKDKKQPTPVPVPVPVRSTTELIKDWARSVIASGADATAAAEQFFREHPDLPWVVLGLGTVAIIVLVADDATLAGIADDVLVPLIATLMRVAWRFA
jgi:hypothetical protein